MKEKDFYRDKIIELIIRIDSEKAIRYIYLIVIEVAKELGLK